MFNVYFCKNVNSDTRVWYKVSDLDVFRLDKIQARKLAFFLKKEIPNYHFGFGPVDNDRIEEV